MDKPLSLPMKLFLLGAGGLAAVAGLILYLWPTGTEVYFAWTIRHPLTPVYMGASFLMGIGAFGVLAINRWSVARAAMPFLIVFPTTQLLATILHLSIFNWAHPVAWAWLAVYVVSPVASVGLFLLNERGYRPPPPAAPRLPAFFAPAMLVLAAISLTVGLALFVVPERAGSLWPWSLTPLTARVIGGWLLATATLQATLAGQRSLETARVGLFISVLAPALLLVGALSHRAAFDGPTYAVTLYLLYQLIYGGVAALGWWRAERSAAQPPFRQRRADEGMV